MLQLLGYSSQDPDAEEGSVHSQLWGSIQQVLMSCLTALTCNSPVARHVVVTAAAERLFLRVLRMGSLRCCSRMLAQAAADMEPCTASAGPKGSGAAQLARRRRRVAASLQQRLTLLADACLMILGLSGHARNAAIAAAAATPDDAAHARWLYGQLISELRASQILEHAARLELLLLITLGAGPDGTGFLPAQDARSLTMNIIILLNCMMGVTGAFLRCAGASLGVPGAPGSRPDVPPPPWGPCCQYLALAQAVSTLAAVGFGGGRPGGGGSGGGGGRGRGDGGGPSGSGTVAVGSGGVSDGSDSSRVSGGGGDDGGSGMYGLPAELAGGLPLLGSSVAATEFAVDIRPGGPLSSGMPTGPRIIHQEVLEQLVSMIEIEIYRADEPAGAQLSEETGGGAGADVPGAASNPSAGGGGGGRESGAAGSPAWEASTGDSGGSRRGSWSLIVGPRAAHQLCMQVAELAIASGQDATPGGVSGRGPVQRRGPRARPLLLRPASAWHVAVRALVTARALLLGPLARRAPAAMAAPAAATPAATPVAATAAEVTAAAIPAAAMAAETTAEAAEARVGARRTLPRLPAEYWGAVVRLLRMHAAPANANEDLLHTGATLSLRTVQMMKLPDLASGGELLVREAPADVAAALSSGLLPALERCMRFHWRSPDPADAECVCGVLLPALIAQPSVLAHVLAFGPLAEVASFVTTVGKLLHSCADQLEATIMGNGGGGGGSVAAAAAANWGRAFGAAKSAAMAPAPDSTFAGAAGATMMYMRQPQGLNEAASVKACRRLSILATNVHTALRWLWSDPRVAALSRDGPAAVSPQLRQMLSLLLQRWLPALTRAVMKASRVPSLGEGLRDVAMDVLSWGSAVAWSAVGPEQLAPPQAAADGVDASAGAGGTASVPTVDSGAAEAGTCSWRRWLQHCGSPAPALALLLTQTSPICQLRGKTVSVTELHVLMDSLLVAMLTQPQQLRSGIRAAAAAAAAAAAVARAAANGSGGGAGSDAADGRSLERRWTDGVFECVSCIPCEPEDKVKTSLTMIALRAMCDGREERFASHVAAAAQRGHVPDKRRFAAALLPPDEAEAVAGAPAGCVNPRCANLGGDGEAELAAAGLRVCAGCGTARYCSRECQRAHWRAGHSGECGGARPEAV